MNTQASVSDLNKELDKAKTVKTRDGSGGCQVTGDVLREMMFNLPGGGGEMSPEIEGLERIRAGPTQGGKPPDQMNPQELHAVLWQVLTFRDSGAYPCIPMVFMRVCMY